MSGTKAPVLLLHGGWGGGWCWSSVAPALVTAGHPVVAPDLPGGGLAAVEPPGFHGQDRRAWAGARSAFADMSLEQYAASTVSLLRALNAQFGPLVVVGHSINGALLHYLGEQAPDAIRRLVYVAAVGPAPGRSVAMDTVEPQWSASLFSALLVADPAKVGALRIDAASADRGYRDAMVRCWFADVPEMVAAVAMRMLSSDNPSALLAAPAELTAARWGSIPRTWIRTSNDASIPVDGQDTNIAQLDAAFPEQRFDVHSLASGHMPFLSLPRQLTDILHRAAESTEALDKSGGA